MDAEIPRLPEPLTPGEDKRISQLTEEDINQIDDALCANTTSRYRKAAMIIGCAMDQLRYGRQVGIPDLYYLTRLKKLVEIGLLESQGNLDYMRFSEVRLRSGSESNTF
jgi:hypothetical protein